MKYDVGDIVRTKKQHPCGSKKWELTRVGVDFKLKCLGCGHELMMPREKALKMITKNLRFGHVASDKLLCCIFRVGLGTLQKVQHASSF